MFAATAGWRSLVALLRCCGLGSDVNDREGLEWILRGLVFESLFVSGPGSAFKVESMDADTLRWHLEGLLNTTIIASNDFLLDLSLRLNRVKRPLLLSVLSCNFLHRSGQETLWVVEAGQPE